MPRQRDATGLVVATRSLDADQLMDAFVRALGMPDPRQAPSPREASPWSEVEWRTWALDHGMVEAEKTRHSFQFKHPELPIFIGVSSTPGDSKARMNLAQDLRKTLMDTTSILMFAAQEALVEFPDIDDQGLANRLLDPSELKRLRIAGAQRNQTVMADGELLGALRSALKKLDGAGIGLRRALAEDGFDENAIERIVLLLRDNATIPCELAKNVILTVNNQLRRVERIEAEAAAEREVEQAARAAKDAEVKADPDKAAFDSRVAQARKVMVDQVVDLQRKVEQLANMVKPMRSVAEGRAFPPYPSERIAALLAAEESARADVDRLTTELAVAHDEIDPLRKRVAELEEHNAKLRRDLTIAETLVSDAASNGEWKASLVAMVNTMEASLASNDFLALAQGVAASRSVLASAKAAVLAGKAPRVD